LNEPVRQKDVLLLDLLVSKVLHQVEDMLTVVLDDRVVLFEVWVRSVLEVKPAETDTSLLSLEI